jgi:glycerate kinase
MKFVLAPDSFKGSLTASQVCTAMEKGIRRVFPGAEIVSAPLADGGEGTVEAMVNASHGTFVPLSVNDPLGNPVEAVYGILGNGQTAIIEMASASGLSLVPENKRNPFNTTTYGTGELIRHAMDKGCRKIIIGIGGSATIDGGSGAAQALGVQFFDELGKEMQDFMNNKKHGRVGGISLKNIHPKIKSTRFIVASDVDNPLLGPDGAVNIYGRQKGAAENDLPVLEENLKNFYDIVEKELNTFVREIPGAGAGGGIGAGLLAFLGAGIEKGVDLVLETVRFKEKFQNADLIFTGEGKLDEQTTFGKTITGVLKAALQQKVPVIALAGSIGGLEKLQEMGLTAAFSICNGPMPEQNAINNAAELITLTIEQICRTYREIK